MLNLIQRRARISPVQSALTSRVLVRRRSRVHLSQRNSAALDYAAHLAMRKPVEGPHQRSPHAVNRRPPELYNTYRLLLAAYFIHRSKAKWLIHAFGTVDGPTRPMQRTDACWQPGGKRLNLAPSVQVKRPEQTTARSGAAQHGAVVWYRPPLTATIWLDSQPQRERNRESKFNYIIDRMYIRTNAIS